MVRFCNGPSFFMVRVIQSPKRHNPGFRTETACKMANYQPYDKRHREMQEDVRPANSRLFILCSRHCTEDMFQKEFSQFGNIEDVWVVKDKRTNENKGLI